MVFFQTTILDFNDIRSKENKNKNKTHKIV